VSVARDRVRVLLLWPGGLFGGGANFGVPQLLSIAGVLEQGDDADVDVVDLDMERGFGGLDLKRLAARGYDLVGISCYSSYDYLKVMEIGRRLDALLPDAWLVTGGYHPSARPDDFTGGDSPFDFVVVGDGEAPMRRLLDARIAGKRPLMRVVGPSSLAASAFIPTPWHKLERYRPVARQLASQAEVYLSRGCPYDCAFCMERAKRDVSWRALEPEAAVEEIHRLDAFLDLSSWTLFLADALFGMKAAWRKRFLGALAKRPCRARKIWLLIRVDLVDREDLELMARANVAPGFGLESGDPQQLKRIRKTGRLDGYLEHMHQVARWARELDVPFGANVIVGHPGETEQSMRNSARYLRDLFLSDSAGTHGFLSVDAFRLYPGSPIDSELERWQQDTGMRAHRYPWWHDGDQEFLAEWVAPSHELDFRRRLTLKRELFDPILTGIADRFAYRGPASDYFARAIDEQLAQTRPEHYLHTIGLWHLWRELTGADRESSALAAVHAGHSGVAEDAELAALSRQARRRTLERCAFAPPATIDRALERVPRERFVAPEHIGEAHRDQALPLSDDGGSTISAMHAYARSFEAVSLKRGDQLVDLGGGTGYGAALASELVGPEGTVRTIELQPELAARAEQLLAPYPQATSVCASAHEAALWRGAEKVVVGFAIEALPEAWREALADGGVLVAPVGPPSRQQLTRFVKHGQRIEAEVLGAVCYVADRRRADGAR
jgi:protein-L-isoaspartate(D-aspartate) O-methyltransferase